MGFLDDKVEGFDPGSGGRGKSYITRARYDVGFRVYVRGVGPEDSWFSSLDRDVQEVVDEVNESYPGTVDLSDPQEAANEVQSAKHVRFTLDRDNVLNHDVSWQGHRQFDMQLWTQGYREVLEPSLVEHMNGVDPMEWAWVEVKFAPDPYQSDVWDDLPEDRRRFIPFVTRHFDSREEAVAAAGGDASAGSSSSAGTVPPAEWDSAEMEGLSWAEWEEDILKDAQELCEEYGYELSSLNKPQRVKVVNALEETFGEWVPREKLDEIVQTAPPL